MVRIDDENEDGDGYDNHEYDDVMISNRNDSNDNKVLSNYLFINLIL